MILVFVALLFLWQELNDRGYTFNNRIITTTPLGIRKSFLRCIELMISFSNVEVLIDLFLSLIAS